MESLYDIKRRRTRCKKAAQFSLHIQTVDDHDNVLEITVWVAKGDNRPIPDIIKDYLDKLYFSERKDSEDVQKENNVQGTDNG